jgi:2,4-dienoyl-CoA reductase-like NADH-dependent reductase (Old Yellow Enzyme family)
MLMAILTGIRDAVGRTPLLGVRVPAFEEVAGGLETTHVAAGLAACAELLDYVNVSVGTHDGLADAQPVLPYTSP